VRGRDVIGSQDLIEDKAIGAASECDGIIGFYTKDDDTATVEYELANNENVVAICQEKGAKSPSIKRSRYQIVFDRSDTGHLLLELLKAIKDKDLFRLRI
jgi:hypothetical protein